MCLHIGSRHAVALMDIGKRVIPAEGIAVHDALHKAADVEESDLVPQEVRQCSAWSVP